MAEATAPLSEMPHDVRVKGPRAGLKWLLEHGLKTEDLEAELEERRAGIGEKVKAAVAGAGAETDRAVDIFEGLPRRTLKIVASGGGNLGEIVLI